MVGRAHPRVLASCREKQFATKKRRKQSLRFRPRRHGRISALPRRTANRPGSQRMARYKITDFLQSASAGQHAADGDRPRSGGSIEVRPAGMRRVRARQESRPPGKKGRRWIQRRPGPLHGRPPTLPAPHPPGLATRRAFPSSGTPLTPPKSSCTSARLLPQDFSMSANHGLRRQS